MTSRLAARAVLVLAAVVAVAVLVRAAVLSPTDQRHAGATRSSASASVWPTTGSPSDRPLASLSRRTPRATASSGPSKSSRALTVGPTPAPNASGLAVRVSGNQLVNRAGQPMRLLGVNLSASEFACDQGAAAPYGWSIFGGPNDQPSTAQAIAMWNANAVRVPLNEDCWLGINGVNPAYGGSTYRNAIVNEVQVLHRSGLYVILDLHWNAPAGFPAQAQQPMADADHAPAFWQSVATTFRNDPAVVFDLYNEPYLANWNASTSDPWGCWLNGGCSIYKWQSGYGGPTVSGTFPVAGMQGLINTIRGTGATQVIMVGGLDWANDMSGWLSHMPADSAHQLAASWHSYPGQPCAVSTCWTNVIAPLAARVPVVVGETGDNVTAAITYVNLFLPWADAHGISYLGWTFNPWGYSANVLIKDWTGTPTANYGVYFQSHLRAFPPQNPYFH